MKWLVSLLLCAGMVFADGHPKADKIKVGVIGFTPFVTQEGSQYDGLTISYWRLIAKEIGLDYEFVNTNKTFDGSVEAVGAGEYDVLVGPLSVTYDRSKIVDYSRPYFVNHVGMVLENKPPKFFDVMISMFGTSALYLLGVFAVLMVIFTHLFYFAERKHAERYQQGYKRGIGDACWTTLSAFLRDVLYDPQSGLGKVILSVWLVLSIVFMAAFTAVVTSTMTYTMTQGNSEITSKRDLEGIRVAVLAESSIVGYAKQFGAYPVEFKNLDEAFELLKSGNVKAIVGNYYELKQNVEKQADSSLIMSSLNLRNDEFAFAFPKDSDLVKKVNKAILRLQDNQKVVDDICEEYLGALHTHSCEF